MDRSTLERKALAELRQIASALELKGYQRMKKADLVDLIIDAGTNGGSPAGNGSAAPAAAASQPELAAEGDRPTGDAGRDDAGQGEPDQTAAAQADTGRGENGGRVRARQRPADRPFRARTGGGEAADDRGDEAADDRNRGRGDDRNRDERDDRNRDERNRDERGRDDRPRGDDGDEDDRGRGKRDRRRKGRGGQQQDNYDDAEVREGILDLLPEGYGFLRCTGYLSGNRDVYVSQSYVRRFDLRRGDRVAGPIRRNKNNDKFPALARIDAIEGESVDEGSLPRKRVSFSDLTPLFPDDRLRLEAGDDSPMSMRIVDMVAPIGRGQRGLLVSPPKAGKTTILKQMAAAIEANNPDVHLMVVLVDERPEEVTDFERSTGGEVISSTFDRPAEDHTQVAELAIERAKRLVEAGRDVVVLLDSITRLGRAYNLATPASGRVLSGGIDSAALYPPKKFFGAARNIEDGGSLTIIATALIETGSKMDEVIFEEFKGTGNMELRLDRRMEQKRVFPAVDIQASGTRREDLLLPQDQIETIWKLRRLLSSMDAEAALNLLIEKLRATKNNDQFLQMISKSNLS